MSKVYSVLLLRKMCSRDMLAELALYTPDDVCASPAAVPAETLEHSAPNLGR